MSLINLKAVGLLLKQKAEMLNCDGCKKLILTDQYRLVIKSKTNIDGVNYKETDFVLCQPCAEKTDLKTIE